MFEIYDEFEITYWEKYIKKWLFEFEVKNIFQKRLCAWRNFKKHIEKDICIKKWLFLFEFDQQGEGNDFELPYSMAGYQNDSLTDDKNSVNSNKSF